MNRAAASAALLWYNLFTGSINFVAEMLLIRSSMHQWMVIHWAIFSPAKYAFAAVEAYFKKWLRRKFQAAKGTRRRKIIDGLALACYQIPLYLLASWLGGRTGQQLIVLFGLSVAEHLIFGQYHGRIMDWCEVKFTNGRVKPELMRRDASD